MEEALSLDLADLGDLPAASQLERDALGFDLPGPEPFFASPYLTLDSAYFGAESDAASKALAALGDCAELANPKMLQSDQMRTDSANTVSTDDIFLQAQQDGPRQDSGSGELQESKSNRQGSMEHDSVPAAATSSGSAARIQLAAVKEKNRVAQAKYRARQRKKRQETSGQVTELTKQLNELQSRQAEMQSRELIFERFLASQRLSLAPQYPGLALTDARTACPDSKLRVDAPAARDAWAASCQTSGFGPQCTVDVWVNKKVRSAGFNGVSDCTRLRAEVLTFTAREGPPLQMTREEAANMTPAEYGALWQDIINGLAACLLRANGDLTSPAGKRLLELCSEGRDLKKTLGFLRPDTLAAHAKQVALQHGAPTTALWAEIAGSLSLTPQQSENCVLLRGAAWVSLGALMRQREELSRKWMTFPGRDGRAFTLDPSDPLHSADAAAQLQSMLLEENSFTAQMMMTLFGRILTPLQSAHSHVLAFPYELNALAFLDAIAAQASQAVPSPHELLQKGAATAEVPPLYESIKPMDPEPGTIQCR